MFRTIYFVPVVTSLVAVSYVWRWLLEPSFGLVNTALGWVGIDGPGWLVGSRLGTPRASIGMTVWRDVGYYMVIFLAGLQTIPKEHPRGGGDRWRWELAALPSDHAAAAQSEHRARRRSSA